MGKKLPEDVIGDILSRLQVKPLLRFRCVSKTWCALIDNKHFIKKHLNHSFLTKTNHTLILHQYELHSLCSIGLYPLNKSLQTLQPINPNHTVTEILGSCNGLLCLSLHKATWCDVIVIWNPATRKHIKLPDIIIKNPFGIQENKDTVCGFGYDSVSDDFKVVILVQFSKSNTFRTEANVYSLRSNSWRKVCNLPNKRFSPNQARSVLACGALHLFTIIKSKSKFYFESMVVSFDIVTEKCGIITQPDFGDHEEFSLTLSELGGCLSILCNYFGVGVIDVWVMKDYGVTESWTKLLTIGSEMIRSYEMVIVLAYSKSGDEVLLLVNFVKFIWYNIEKKTTKLFDVRGLPGSFFSVICLESLVSLGENAENDEFQGGKSEGAKYKKEREEKFLSVGFKLVL